MTREQVRRRPLIGLTLSRRVGAGLKGMMNVLASDFGGMAPLVFIAPVLFALAVASFFPSAQGHWSGPALAAPLGLGALAFVLWQFGLDPGRLMEAGVFVWCLLLVPVVVAAGSVVLWAVRRGSRAV